MSTKIRQTDNDDKAPKRDKSKPKDCFALCVSLGLLAGCAIGAVVDDIGLWLSIGVMLGVAVGCAFGDDKEEN